LFFICIIFRIKDKEEERERERKLFGEKNDGFFYVFEKIINVVNK
jgi:hypothetical protein